MIHSNLRPKNLNRRGKFGINSKSKKISPKSELRKGKPSKTLDMKQKLAQNKLITQVRANFAQIHHVKDVKTKISEQVFKYAEHLLYDKIVRKNPSWRGSHQSELQKADWN